MNMYNDVVITAPRQVGKTTAICMYICDLIMESKDFRIEVVCHNLSNAGMICEKLAAAMKPIELGLQQKVGKYSIDVDSKNIKIQFRSTGSHPTYGYNNDPELKYITIVDEGFFSNPVDVKNLVSDMQAKRKRIQGAGKWIVVSSMRENETSYPEEWSAFLKNFVKLSIPE